MICWPWSLFQREESFHIYSTDTTIIPLKWNFKTVAQSLWILHASESTSKEGVTVLAGMSDVDYQVGTGLVCHSGGKEEYVWNTGDLWGDLLVLPCPVIKTNGKLQQPKPGKAINDPDPLGMKVWVIPPSEKPQPAEVFAEGKKNIEWVVEKSSYVYHLVTLQVIKTRTAIIISSFCYKNVCVCVCDYWANIIVSFLSFFPYHIT